MTALFTPKGHNMFDMASMLQKACRRNYPKAAMYAAYELFGRYYAMLWKRLLVISGEDCFGMLTKQIVDLKEMDERANEGKSGYDRDFRYVEAAVNILCRAKKNRDACYLACNFMIVDWGCSEAEYQEIGHVNMGELMTLRSKYDSDPTPDKKKADGKKQEEKKEEFHQMSLFET